MENIEVTTCPSCKAKCDNTAKFCDSCGLLLSLYQKTSKMPDSGLLSVMSAPVGFVVAIMISIILPKHDFLGFVTILLIWVVLLFAGATSIISGVVALSPTMNSSSNKLLGVTGILLGALTICSALFLKKWINFLA